MLGVRTTAPGPAATGLARRGRATPWLKYAFILTPVALSVAGLVSYSSENLREAYAEMKAEMNVGESDRARLEGIGLASKKGSAEMAEKEFQKIVGSAQLTAKQITNAAELDASAIVVTAQQESIVKTSIGKNFTPAVYGRNPQIAQMALEVARLRIEVTNRVEIVGNLDTLAVDHFWTSSEDQRVRPVKVKQLLDLQARLREVEESGIREGYKEIMSFAGRGR
jgi:hypothetical protein